MKGKVLLAFLAVMLLVSPIAIVGCEATAPPVEEEPIKIGGLFELSGGLASIGIESLNGVTLALEEVNYEVAGRPIEFIVEDIADDPAMAMDKARKLVEIDKVDLLIGPIFSAAVNAVAPYYDSQGVPAINASGQLEEIPLTMNWIWLPITTMRLQGYAMGCYAYEELGYRTASCMAQDYVAGWEYMGGFIEAFEEAGGVVVQQQWVAFGTLDLTPYIITIEDADVLAMWFVGNSLMSSVLQLRELGVWEKMDVVQAAETGLAEPTVLEQVADATEGLITGTEYCCTLDTPGNEAFVQAYQQKFGRVPGTFAGNSYSSMTIALQAIRNAGGDVSPETLAQALDEIDMDTVRGHISFNPMHTGITKAFIIRYDEVGEEIVLTPLAAYQVWLEKVGDELVMHAERME